MILKLVDIKTAVENASSKYNLKKVSLFGSYANGEANDESDVDLLVEFKDNDNVSLLTITEIKYDLEEKLNKPVDVIHAPVPNDSLIEVRDTVNLYG